MVMLCFVLDLRNLSPTLLRDLKQSLLQLANFYAISAQFNERSHSKTLCDRIGLCYLQNNRISRANEVAYTPRGNFSLRDFHHAVNNVPTDAFFPEFCDSGSLYCDDMKLSRVVSKEVLYSWVGSEKDITKKVILISSCLVETIDSQTKEALMVAADKCVSVEFVLLEQKSSHLGDLPEKINNFVKHISDLENCCFKTFLPDPKAWCFIVKRWLQDLKDDAEEQLQARFNFKYNLAHSMNQIYCNLWPSFNSIVDGFSPCQTCRCHGRVIEDKHRNSMKRSLCSVTGNVLGESDLVENSVMVGGQTVLLMPSFQSNMKHQRVTSSIEFNVIERTDLRSLTEGVIMGPSYIVTSSLYQESDEIDKSELNSQAFQGLCSTLNSLDQGLVCSSYSNIETSRETSFQCYYILLPSENGQMLLRRLAGSEEVLPVPDASQLSDSALSKEIEKSIKESLLKMEITDYNPVLHERGFHQRLNLLVKESLQFGSLNPKMKDFTPAANTRAVSFTQATEVVMLEDENPTELKESKSSVHITDKSEESIFDEFQVTEPSTQRHSSETLTNFVLINEGIPEPKLNKGTEPSTQRHSSEKLIDFLLVNEEIPEPKPNKGTEPLTQRHSSETLLDFVLVNEEIPELKPKKGTESSTQRHSSDTLTDFVLINEEIPEPKQKKGGGRADITNASIAEEWEQMIITEVPSKKYSPTCIARPKLVLSPPECNKKLDEKTSRILERLELPRQFKAKAVSPNVSCGTKINVPMTKKPLIPFESLHSSQQDVMPSQPMKPNFQRLKRKHR